MSLVRDQHRQAMDLAERAFAAKLLGDHKQARVLFEQAFEHERRAAESMLSDFAAEPTRSVLYRSAATLALDCKQPREAERLAAVALAGNPPEEIAEELRSVLEQVSFHRHLELKGITLEPEEVQLSMAGNVTGYGITRSAGFAERLQVTEKLFQRTAERKRGLRFRERGPAKKPLREDFEMFISVPRAASFAVTIRLGRSAEQLSIPMALDTSEIIDEMLRCLELLERSDEKELRQRFLDEGYYRSFLGLARRLAPDGEDVKMVGFTTARCDEEQSVVLTKSPEELPMAGEVTADQSTGGSVRIRGELQFADARDVSKASIRIIDERGKEHRVIVPEGMMSDIVKPLWEDLVIVTGLKKGREIWLQDIERAAGD